MVSNLGEMRMSASSRGVCSLVLFALAAAVGAGVKPGAAPAWPGGDDRHPDVRYGILNVRSDSPDTGSHRQGGFYSTVTGDHFSVYAYPVDHSVHIGMGRPGPNGALNWEIALAAPDGARLVPGTYRLAERYPSQRPGHPGLSVVVSGAPYTSNCGEGPTGEFTVSRADYDDQDQPLVLEATFNQRCDGWRPALHGEVHVVPSVEGTLDR